MSAASARLVAEIVFWGSGFVLAYTFVGYSLIMKVLAAGRRTSSPKEPDHWPRLTVVLVAFNEESRIVPRLENLLESRYPIEDLEIVVVSDGSTDETAARVQSLALAQVRLIEFAQRSGKAAGLNLACAASRSEIIAFADSRQSFTRETLPRLAAWFTDPEVGAVSGSLEIKSAVSPVGQAVGSYWEHEKALRSAESRFDSCIGCTGAVYAVRRGLFTAIPEDTLLDDVVIPMQIAVRGYRVIHDPEATAFDPQALEPEPEQRRKRRTLAGNFQMLFRYPRWMLPGQNRLWWQLLSHKYLRIFAPFFLAVALAANGLLLDSPFYRILFIMQVALYGCGFLGLRFPALGSRCFTIPAGFMLLNLSTVRAFAHYIRGTHHHLWHDRRTNPAGPL